MLGPADVNKLYKHCGSKRDVVRGKEGPEGAAKWLEPLVTTSVVEYITLEQNQHGVSPSLLHCNILS